MHTHRTQCRYGSRCTRTDCRYSHPGQLDRQNKSICRYGLRCTRSDCWHEHPQGRYMNGSAVAFEWMASSARDLDETWRRFDSEQAIRLPAQNLTASTMHATHQAHHWANSTALNDEEMDDELSLALAMSLSLCASPAQVECSSAPGQQRSNLKLVGQVECVVCLESLDGLDEVVLPCGHCFHKACLSSWLDCDRTCPLCRGAV